jgi:hypothetical protein
LTVSRCSTKTQILVIRKKMKGTLKFVFFFHDLEHLVHMTVTGLEVLKITWWFVTISRIQNRCSPFLWSSLISWVCILLLILFTSHPAIS